MTTEILSLEVKEDGSRVVTRRIDGIGRQSIKAGNSVQKLQRDLKKLGSNVNPINQLRRSLGGLGGVLALSSALDQSFKFGDAIAEVSTLVDEATFSMTALSKAAKQQAIDFGSQPVQQSQALYQIISAGASDSADAIETLTAANKLAVGGVTDVAIAADGLTTIMNAYGDQAGTAADISDTLFVGMRAGKTTIEELASSLGKVVPLSESAGVSFDELVAATAALTKGGISTSESITGLRAVMAAIVKPTKEASDLARSMGIEFNVAGLRSRGLVGFIEHLTEQTNGSTDALATLFGGVEALVPIMALTGKAGESFNEIMGDMSNKIGETDTALNKITQGDGFKFRQFLALSSTLMISLGDAIATVLVPILDLLVNRFDDITLAAGGFIATLSIAKIGAIGAGIKALTANVAALTAVLAANPIGLLAVAISSAVGALVFFRNEIKIGTSGIITLRNFAVAAFDIMREKITPFIDSFVFGFKEVRAVALDALESINLSFDDLFSGAKEFINNLIRAFFGGIDTIVTIIQVGLNNLNSLFSGGGRIVGVDEFANILENRLTRTFEKDYVGAFVNSVNKGFDAIETRALELKRIREEAAAESTLGNPDTNVNIGDVINNDGNDSQGFDAKVVGAIRDINEQLRIERDLLLETSPAAREVAGQLIAISTDLKGRNILLSEEEIESNFAGMIRLNQQLRERAQILDNVNGPQEEFTNQVKAIQDLVNSGDITGGQAAAQINEISGGLLEGTAELQSAYVQQWRDTYAQINELRQADLVSEKTANLLKFKADSEFLNQRLSTFKEGFTALEGLSNSSNSKIAAIGKAAAIANATIDTYRSATAAYASLAGIPIIGPALGAAAAAAAIATGLASVSKIRSTNVPGRALGGTLESGQVARVGESSFNRPEIFQGSSGRQFFIPPERGTVTPLRESRGQNQNIQQNQPVVKNEMSIANFIDPGLFESYMMSASGRQTFVNMIQEESSTVKDILGMDQ